MFAERPVAYQVELTNHCPYTCLGCPRTEDMKRGLGMMSFDTFKTVIDTLGAQQRARWPLALHHMGESLLHPKITSFVEYATRNGVPTALACRPNHLTPERARALIDAGLCILIVSVDGMDTPTLKTISGKVADYESAAQNIEKMLALKAELDSPIHVVLQMIAYSENEHQWDRFLTEWNRRDESVFVALKRFSSWTVPSLSQFAALSQPRLGARCSRPFWSFVVLWDGRIVPCCNDHDGAVVLGHVDDGIDAVWNSGAFAKFRQEFDDDALPDDHMCRRCSDYPWRKEAEAPKTSSRPWFGSDAPNWGYSEQWWLEHWGHRMDSNT